MKAGDAIRFYGTLYEIKGFASQKRKCADQEGENMVWQGVETTAS